MQRNTSWPPNPAMAANIEITAVPAKGADAVIATGSDNTARYFEQYFKDIPALIRRSRASVAVVSEETTDEDLSLLAGDIMKYFGMGCRSISLVFLPAGFDIRRAHKSPGALPRIYFPPQIRQ